MKVRLVAYRPATSGASVDTTYELDLLEEPNISLNYQFSDIKEPDTRKTNFSQTFKLPFTDANNTFFENWFNVNLTTLAYSTRSKFNAILYVGTVPQFDGYIQLKQVYLKAQYYEVVLMSNTANLFSAIGNSPLVDALKNPDETFSTYFNHTFNETNIKASWDGTTDGFLNNESPAVSLRDSSVNVQKIMYPLIANKGEFFYNGDDQYLCMSQTDINAMGIEDATNYTVDIGQLRPAIQIKALFQLILARAGFSYTSTFIDSEYFGRLFMTLGGKLGDSQLPITSTVTSVGGVMRVGNSGTWGLYTNEYSGGTGFEVEGCQSIGPTIMPADTTSDMTDDDNIFADNDNCWNTTYNCFTKLHPTMIQADVEFEARIHRNDMCEDDDTGDPISPIMILIALQGFDPATGLPTTTSSGATVYYGAGFIEEIEITNPSLQLSPPIQASFDISDMPVGASARFEMHRISFEASGAGDAVFNLGGNNSDYGPNGNYRNTITIQWEGYDTAGVYGEEINVASCFDDSISQKAFLKDIIQRFNMIVLADPGDATNLIFLPYDQYLGSGDLKDWTHKLDTSKDIIIRDTTTLQKKNTLFTDLEDVDLWNKYFKEELPLVNVYGKFTNLEANNDFATGTLTNNPIFSPYINDMIYTDNDANNTLLNNVTVMYNYTYNTLTNGDIEPASSSTKPKLFYYCGVPTNILDTSGTAVTSGSGLHMHFELSSGMSITAYEFLQYPVCSPFDIIPVSDVYTLTSANKSLYWDNTNIPIASGLNIFNVTTGTTYDSLYFAYWYNYLNGIYGIDARIMECHMNLNETDIFQFKFSDEIFIKDTYWRILDIKNYQVGAKASTKVTFIKVLQEATASGAAPATPEGCSFVLHPNQLPMFGIYVWNPDTDPDNTDPYTQANFFATEACCNSVGGYINPASENTTVYTGLVCYVCFTEPMGG